MLITKSFSEKELNCRCGLCDSRINLNFAMQLQQLRDCCGFALPLSSGARCSEHNIAVGGAENSRHLYGEAVDIAWGSFSGWQRMKLLACVHQLGFNGIGIGSSLLHIDTRPGNNIIVWFYKDN